MSPASGAPTASPETAATACPDAAPDSVNGSSPATAAATEVATARAASPSGSASRSPPHPDSPNSSSEPCCSRGRSAHATFACASAARNGSGTASATGVAAIGDGSPATSPGTRIASTEREESGIHSAGCGPSVLFHGPPARKASTTAAEGCAVTVTVTQWSRTCGSVALYFSAMARTGASIPGSTVTETVADPSTQSAAAALSRSAARSRNWNHAKTAATSSRTATTAITGPLLTPRDRVPLR
ncbi:hypothetical protein [Nocardia farcinica]